MIASFRRSSLFLLAAASLVVGACTRAMRSGAVSSTEPPVVRREFRGVWVATVGNIDWPSKPGLSTAQQQAELLAILDQSVALHLNAVVLQVRPAADALYASSIEPWSEFLTGTMGRAPQPFYDPLAFAVTEAHRRGLELHAWFNPYRARPAGATSPVAATHVSVTQPEIVRRYGKMLWMDPGEPATQQQSLRVIADVVRRYDVDGVHIDDYFYPYPEDSAGKAIPFPDSASYARYLAGGGRLTRDDWRRSNVDTFVRRMYEVVRQEKPWVKVGISPFGIWRPGSPPHACCFDAYTTLYADARRWLREGWADYFTPQLYWKIAARQQSYPELLDWWAAENVRGRHLWPGNSLLGLGAAGARAWPVAEIDSQIAITRAQPRAGGNVYFSMQALMRNRGGIADSLAAGAYAAPALVPATPWLAAPGSRAPGAPVVQLTRGRGQASLSLAPAAGEAAPWQWLIRARTGGRWQTVVLPGAATRYVWPAAPDAVRTAAVDRFGRVGADVVLPAMAQR